MTRELLEDLALVWALESVDADITGNADEASRLADEARQIRELAGASTPRALAITLHDR